MIVEVISCLCSGKQHLEHVAGQSGGVIEGRISSSQPALQHKRHQDTSAISRDLSPCASHVVRVKAVLGDRRASPPREHAIKSSYLLRSFPRHANVSRPCPVSPLAMYKLLHQLAFGRQQVAPEPSYIGGNKNLTQHAQHVLTHKHVLTHMS